jgi:hypothetical protein
MLKVTMRHPRPVRPLRTLVVAVPLWIVMILTGGQWCLMPQGVAHPVVSSASGVGHAGDGGHVATGGHAVHAAAVQPVAHDAHGAGDARSPGSSHRQHESNGASCESQAPCSVAIAAASLQLAESPAPHHAKSLTRVTARPHSLALAPELPPPRA